MSATLPLLVVDAFAEQPYRGNPAGVVLEADGLDDGQCRAIAREVNLSETAFVSRLNDLHRPPQLRWFTPAAEVDFCGHATLAASYALYASGYLGRGGAQPAVKFETRAGTLNVVAEPLPGTSERLVWWLDMPQVTLAPERGNPIRLCAALGLSTDDLDESLAPLRTSGGQLILFVQSWQRLVEMQPRFDDLAAWCTKYGLHGVCVATTAVLTPGVNVHSRYFAPVIGVNEDPVTGSVHGPLALVLVTNELVGRAGSRAGLLCEQGRPGDRGGIVRVVVEESAGRYTVRVGGLCHVTIRGTVEIPPAPASPPGV